MQVVVTSQPEPLVTVEEAKVAIGESGTDRDAFIQGLVLAAQAELDGPLGWVGISVAEQSVQVKVSSFDEPPVRLPGGPILGPVVLTYLDGDGIEQSLDDGTYIVAADGSVTLASGASWPTLAEQSNAATFAYDVGIPAPGEGDQPDPRISLMKTAIILHVRMTIDAVEPAVSRRAIESLVRPMWVPVC